MVLRDVQGSFRPIRAHEATYGILGMLGQTSWVLLSLFVFFCLGLHVVGPLLVII